jgi:hypothetical protein
MVMRRAGARVRLRTSRSVHRVRVEVCASRNGKAVVQMRRRARGHRWRVLQSRRVSLRAGHTAKLHLRRARHGAVRVRYRPDGALHTVVLDRRLPQR